RTCDLASVLRTPGTHHRKGEPKLVRVGDLTGPYKLNQFDIFLEGEEDATSLQLSTSRRPARASSGVSAIPSIISAAANIYADEPNFTEPVVRACAQV